MISFLLLGILACQDQPPPPTKPAPAPQEQRDEAQETVEWLHSLGYSKADKANLGELRDLNLSQHPAPATEKLQQHLSQLTGLHRLNLKNPKISVETLSQLGQFTELRMLSLPNHKKIDRAVLPKLKKLQKLQQLRLDGTGLQGADLEDISRALPTLQALSLEGLSIDTGVHHLTLLTKLHKLNLGSSDISDQGLEHIAKISSLQSLFLWHTSNISKAGVAKLKRLPQLRNLYVEGTPLDDDIMPSLAQFPRLANLWVVNLPITDKGFKRLRKSKSIQTIWAKGSNISSTGIRKLKKKHPHIKIHQ